MKFGQPTMSALDAAEYLIRLAAADDESEYMTHMRVQKLLYYAQGWSLATRNRPLFRESIEAWTYGPVVVSVFHHFKDHGRRGIEPGTNETIDISEEDRELLDGVWETYGEHSAISLSRMTHSEPPWKEARKNHPRGVPCDNEIALESLKAYFDTLVE